MELSAFFKAVLEVERSAVVLCNLDHVIVYMNPFAKKRYHRDLTGQNLMDCHNADSRAKIESCLAWFKESPENNHVYEFYNEKENKDVYLEALRNDAGELIGYWERHCYRTKDTGKFYDFQN